MHPTTKLLENARAQVSFPIKELTKILYHDERMYKLVIEGQEIFDNYPELSNNADYYNLSRKEQLLNNVRKLEIFRKHINMEEIDDSMAFLGYSQSRTFTSTQYAMVLPAIRILGTEEQVQRWEQDCVDLKIIGAYAQTEIGHGSDIQSLETTATLDKLNDQFIIHSPSVSATKYWPGELGLLANYALVYAQLIIDGKKNGVFPFMVPIRHKDTHKPLPGIIVGDIGPKLGYETKDNGYLALNHVSIPRSNMLMRFINVSREGIVTKQGNEKVSYSSMMLVRKMLIYAHSRIPAQSLTVAIRYSIVRQQFKNDNGQENQVLDYQSQQDKLLPLLAKQYAVVFGGLYAKALVEDNFDRVKRNDFSIMQLTHCLLSGFKANYTYFTNESTEWCRISCGGHGFAHYSGLPVQFLEFSPNVTLEGENKVMYLQMSRFLLKILQLAKTAPEKIPSEFEFLKDTNQTLSRRSSAINVEQLIDLKVLEMFLQQNSASILLSSQKKLTKYISQGLSSKDAQDYKVNDDLLAAADAFMEYLSFNIFVSSINRISDPSISNVLTQLCQLFGVHTILTKCVYLIEDNLITVKQLKQLRVAKDNLLIIIKKEAIGLVDSFGFSDKHLKTLIGQYNGKPYEHMMDWASQENSMNIGPVSKGIMHLKQVKPKL